MVVAALVSVGCVSLRSPRVLLPMLGLLVMGLVSLGRLRVPGSLSSRLFNRLRVLGSLSSRLFKLIDRAVVLRIGRAVQPFDESEPVRGGNDPT